MSVESMKQALTALKAMPVSEANYGTYGEANRCKAIELLLAAIAEAEKQKPVAWINTETAKICTGGFLRKDLANWQPLYVAPTLEPSALTKMKEVLDVQGRDGNWDSDPYMGGMYNGMELMLAIAENREPVFRDPPEKRVD